MAKDAELLGTALTEIDAAQIQSMNESMIKARQAASGLGTQLSLQVAPVIEAVANEFLNSAREAGGMGEIASKAMNVAVSAAGILANTVRTLQIAWTGVKLAVAGVVGGIVLGMVEADKAVSSFLNALPGIEAVPSQTLQNIHDSFANTYDDINADLQELLMKPVPSAAIKEWVADVQAKSLEAAKRTVEEKGSISNILTGVSAANDELVGPVKPEESSDTPNNAFLDQLTSYQDLMTEFENVSLNTGAVIEDVFANTARRSIDQMSDGIANAIANGEDLDDVFRQTARTMGIEVVSSLIKVATQMAINKAMSTAFKSAEVAESAAAGTAVAASWAPAAAASSLATVGTNSIAAIAGISATMAAVMGLSGIAHTRSRHDSARRHLPSR